jgi:hypothetical protein
MSFTLALDTQKHDFALYNNACIVKHYFSEDNKELIKNKVKRLLSSDEFIIKWTTDTTISACVNSKINSSNYERESIYNDICFDRLDDYMMDAYNSFVETQFVDSVKRELVFDSNKKRIINYLDCNVIKTVLRESKLSLQEHYYYMKQLNKCKY